MTPKLFVRMKRDFEAKDKEGESGGHQTYFFLFRLGFCRCRICKKMGSDSISRPDDSTQSR
jgi:hypothetical protein